MAGLACLALAAASAMQATAAAPGPKATSPRTAPGARAPAACRPNPLGMRTLHVRGDFNQWAADEGHALAWNCSRFEGVVTITGDARFKLGDEGWSADADFGAAPGSSGDVPRGIRVPLAAKGRELHHAFHGTHRITLDMADPTTPPTLAIDDCAAAPAGDATLFLRGGMNGWAAMDDAAFRYACDAYYLNVDLKGRHEFKVGDAAWTPVHTFGGKDGAALDLAADVAAPLGRGDAARGTGNLGFDFHGEHTLRLAFPGGMPTLSVGAKSWIDPNAATVTDPVALSLRHDSRAPGDKAPFGAVTAGTEVAFALHAAPGVEAAWLVLESRRLEGNQDVLEYREFARLPMAREPAGAGGGELFRARHRFADTGVVGYWFLVRIAGVDYAYQNNRDTVPWTREKGSNGPGRVEPVVAADWPAGGPREGVRAATPAAIAALAPSTATVRRYRLTVYDPAFTVPDWAQDAVWYYIFPERYRNGDRGNDPRPGVDKYHDGTVELHARWNERPFKPGTGDGSDERYSNDFFGGDIAGIVDKLDDIAALGANALYITPMFTAASNHKYDTADYLHIDPHFGRDADFGRLTREAARRGIRVVPDASLNHVGMDSVYFDRFGNHGGQGAFANGRINPDSPWADWFTFDATQADPDKQYKGWVGVRDLPELDKHSASFRRFAFGAPDSVMLRWLDAGAAGWRMDVAPWVPDDFWRDWRAAIKAHRPDAVTIAETWFDASKYFTGDMFDSTMNYIFRNAVLDYAGGGDARKSAASLELLREAYPAPAFHALMNLLSSHDVARSLHVLGWHDGAGGAPRADDPATVALAKQRLRLAMFFQMTYPGAPAIFYGDEVGMTGGDDPYNRGPYPWPDQGGQPDLALLAEVKALVAMRKAHPVFARGTLDAPLLVDAHRIVLLRRLGDAWAVTATSNDAAAASVRVQLPPGAPHRFRDARTGAVHVADAAGRLDLALPAMAGLALVADGAPQ
jgi:glycosidase